MNEISFSYEWLYTRPGFQVNSDIYLETKTPFFKRTNYRTKIIQYEENCILLWKITAKFLLSLISCYKRRRNKIQRGHI